MEKGKHFFLINNALKYYRNGTGLECSSLKFKSYFMNLLA